MKKENLILYTGIAVSVLNLGLLIWLLCRQPSSPAATEGIPLPAAAPATGDICVPATMEFAGEATPLQRQDVLEALEKELVVNTYLHSHTTQILKRAPRAFAIIEPILREEGIPDDFKYLAVIESRLEPLIVSPAGAAGIWQIMKETGKELGLEVNNEVDERYHLAKATRAAAAYLRKSYEKFGSWTLAAAAYNAGNRFMEKQMDLQREDNYYDLLLGEETGRYVYRILALKQILLHPGKYNFQVRSAYPPEPSTMVKVNTSVDSWADFARHRGFTYKTLKRLNPWLRKPSLRNARGKTYEIAVPAR